MTHSRTAHFSAAIATVFALGGAVAPPHGFAADQPQSTIPAKPAPAATDVAAPRRGRDGEIDKSFLQRHESFRKRGKADPIGLLFMGDSITGGWDWNKEARELWQQHFGTHQPANFGLPGDSTQHVLWRIENGELDGISPKVVVLLIGTNNIGASPENIVRGCAKVVSEIRRRLPQSKLLLLGIFPRGADPKDPDVAYGRTKVKLVNLGLAKLDDGVSIRYLDIGDKFLDANGVISKDVMPDALHPGGKGYRIWAEAMQPLLTELLK